MICELIANWVNTLFLMSSELKGKKCIECKAVELISYDGYTLWTFKSQCDNSEIGYDDRITKRLSIFFHRTHGLSLKFDDGWTEYSPTEIGKIYLTTDKGLLAIVPYNSKNGVVWDILDSIKMD